jgi:multiple sugar transport system substrate-binding protein
LRVGLLGGAGVFASAVLAACGGSAPVAPTAAPAAAAPPTTAPTTAPAAAAPTVAPTKAAAPTTAPTAAPTTAAATAPTPTAAAAPAGQAGVKLLIWRGQDFFQGLNPVLRARWDEYAKNNNITLDWDPTLNLPADALPAAIQAGQPPDITGASQVQYWRAQGQLTDLTDAIGKYATQSGNWWPYVGTEFSWQSKWYASPLGVGLTAWHVRQDLLDQVNAGKWATSLDDMRAIAKKVNKPPFMAYGLTLGPALDAAEQFVELLWGFGGKLLNDDGTWAMKETDDAGLAVLNFYNQVYNVDKIVPQGAIDWNDGGNNAAYQGALVAWVMNAPSIFSWLQANKPDLYKQTSLYRTPAGPQGSHPYLQPEGHVIYKGAKHVDAAMGALAYLLDPTWYASFIEQVLGRYGPIYQDLLNKPFWSQNSNFKELAYVTQNGRTWAYSGPPVPAFLQIINKFYLSDLIHDYLVKKLSPQDAMKNLLAKVNDTYSKNPIG